MRLRVLCRCGGEYDARGTAGSVGDSFSLWQQLHAPCLGVEGWRFEGDKLVLKPMSSELADALRAGRA